MQPLTVADMMTTTVKVIHEDEALSTAHRDMVVGEFRHVVVVDRSHRLVGVLSDRDIERSPPGRNATVAELMTRDVHAVSPSTPALEAVEHLLVSKFGALPVVDSGLKLLGIVTTTDFLEIARRALAGLDVNLPHARA